jgi:acetyl-CoA synthetase
MYKIENHRISDAARVNTHADEETYARLYRQSIDDPDTFWAEQAKRFLDWDKPWTRVHESDLTRGEAAWFIDGKLNVSTNCIDRHLAKRGDQTAIIWEGDDPADSRNISYRELHEQVCRLANVLKERGVRKGDRVCLYMPMIPEAAYAMLACARIGAVHSVVFGGFSPDALRDRINDADCQAVITADEGVRGGKKVPLKQNVEKALKECPGVHTVIAVKRTGGDIPWVEGRDVWYEEACAKVDTHCPAESMDSEDPLFILYTSGSTGKPKGVLHTPCRLSELPKQSVCFWITRDG